VTPDLQIQRDVPIAVLREDPDVLTLQALADRVLANPRSLTGGIALARALQKLDSEGLVISDGVLVRASRPALYFKRTALSIEAESDLKALYLAPIPISSDSLVAAASEGLEEVAGTGA
jgi:hypothetical protein